MVKESKDTESFSFFDNVLEAGQRLVQKGYKISIRDICKNNEIEEGNIVVIYVKYLNTFLEAGQRRVQKEFKISIRDICENNNIKEGEIIIIYIKKTNIKSTKDMN